MVKNEKISLSFAKIGIKKGVSFLKGENTEMEKDINLR